MDTQRHIWTTALTAARQAYRAVREAFEGQGEDPAEQAIDSATPDRYDAIMAAHDAAKNVGIDDDDAKAAALIVDTQEQLLRYSGS